jgi:anti-anti-sigma factor
VACAKQDDDGPVTAVSPFSTVTEHYGQRSLMRLEGELDVCGTDRLRQAMTDALHRAPKTLVADLSALGFTDCAGLAVLVWAHQSLAGRGRELIITGCQPSVRRLLSLTGFDMYLHVSDEPADTFLVQGGGAGRGQAARPFGIMNFLPP